MLMNKTSKDQRWVFHQETELQPCGSGVCRKILAYTDELMCVENRFEKGFRQRDVWSIGEGKRAASRDTESANVLGGSFSKDGNRGKRS